MADTAAHLVDRVLPRVAVRQWVLSLPFSLRFGVAFDRGLCSRVRSLFMAAVLDALRRRAREQQGVADGRSGAVVFVQRFGRVSLEWLDADGQVQQFYPNALHADDRITASGVLEIPDDTMGFELTVSEGAGNEALRAVVVVDDGSRAQAMCGFRITPNGRRDRQLP